MTICIAAICANIKTIVMVSDEVTVIPEDDRNRYAAPILKQESLDEFDGWHVMFTCDDVQQAQSIIARCRHEVSSRKRGNESLPAHIIREACSEAYRKEYAELFNVEMLLPLGLTHAEYLKHGRKLFGRMGCRDIRKEFSERDIGVELLVVGFDSDGLGHMFTMSSKGRPTVQSQWNFHAIGLAYDIALSGLYQDSHFCDRTDLNEIAYRMLCAKFYAESVTDIGRETTLRCYSPGSAMRYMTDNDIDEVRRIWKYQGRPPFPDDAGDVIKDGLLALPQHWARPNNPRS